MYEDPFDQYAEKIIEKLNDAKKTVRSLSDAVNFHCAEESDLFDSIEKKHDAFIFCMSCLSKEISEEFMLCGQDFYCRVRKNMKFNLENFGEKE